MNAQSILATIGNTPHVRVNRLFDPRVEVWAKLERANPGGSIKDRIALAMVEDAEARGILAPGLGHHRADVGQHRHRPCPRLRGQGLPADPHACPSPFSIERRKLMTAYGAELELTPRELGMKGAIARANELAAEIPDAWIPMQFDNPANPRRPPPDDGRRRSCPTSPTGSTTSSPASAPAATSPGSPRCSSRAGRA